MKIQLIKGDITKQVVDVIVNAANSALAGGGGVDGAIHRAAGPELGEAVVTKAFALPAKYIIHTVGPVWHGGNRQETSKLASCYWKSLDIAAAKGLKSIAFPNISTGVYQFPKELAAEVAIYTIREWLDAEPGSTITEIRLVCFDEQNLQLYVNLLGKKAIID